MSESVSNMSGSAAEQSKNGLKITALLGLVMAARIIGLAVVLPVLAHYANNLPGGTPALAAMAIGIYGLTQAVLQVPFGMLSDKTGRKAVVILGLGLFAVGSVLAAIADNAWLLLLARALQGGGAIAAVINAWVADITTDKQRTAGMAILGAAVGMTFLLALIAGAPLANAIGVSGLFWLSAGLAIAGSMTVLLLPTPPNAVRASKPDFKLILARRDLLVLDSGVFVLHLALAAVFFAVPLLLSQANNTTLDGSFYVWPLLAGAVLGLPLLFAAEKMKQLPIGLLMMAAATVLGVAVLALSDGNILWLQLGLGIFFTGFVFMEAAMPSMTSKRAPADAKGAVMGTYSSSQFFGIFCGGGVAALLSGWLGLIAVLVAACLLLSVWLLILLLNRQHL